MRNVKEQKQTAQTVAGSNRVSFSVFTEYRDTDTETAMCVWREKQERFGKIAQTLILGYVPGGQDIPLKHPQPERITYTEILLTLSSYLQCKRQHKLKLDVPLLTYSSHISFFSV